jgi:hypothetical protein
MPTKKVIALEHNKPLLNNELSSFNVKELKAQCKLLKIEKCYNCKKAQLIKLIETKQEETKQKETKQEETKQEETKQEETKQEETKQEETKQEETKQEETKQEETKQEETKQEETKQEETKQKETKQEETIIKSQQQTKKWRLKQPWYIDGKKNECEKYQIKLLEYIVNTKIEKTYLRINIYNNTTIEINNTEFSKLLNKFQFSENFDGKIILNNNIIYFNLKMITDKGGAQTRSIKEVFHFIIAQEKWIETQNNTYIMNILDGEFSFNNIKFLPNINSKNIFIGDMYQFHNYFQETFLK